MTCPAAQYLARAPESLVIGGYRQVLIASTGECPAIDTMWRLHLERLGVAESRVVIDGLSMFMATMRRAAGLPLRCLPDGTCHLCRDECLVLSLIAGLQHGDDVASRISADALSAPGRMGEAIGAAGDYAMRLKMFGQVLLPIPPLVVADILAGPPRPQPSHSTTVH